MKMKEQLKNQHMEIWDQVSRTDIDHTKEVTFGRKFTAIDAHSQIMEATRLFGPVGEGWGYKTVYGFQDTSRGETFVWCDLTLWWKGNDLTKGANSYGPIRGMSLVQGFKLGGEAKTSDHDASKKAMTDALTKGLSHLGFNADVFLGMFEDNKYLAELKAESTKRKRSDNKEDKKQEAALIKAIKKTTSEHQIEDVKADYRDWFKGLDRAKQAEIAHTITQHEESLS